MQTNQGTAEVSVSQEREICCDETPFFNLKKLKLLSEIRDSCLQNSNCSCSKLAEVVVLSQSELQKPSLPEPIWTAVFVTDSNQYSSLQALCQLIHKEFKSLLCTGSKLNYSLSLFTFYNIA